MQPYVWVTRVIEINEGFSQSINQSIDTSINQSIKQSVNKSINQSISFTYSTVKMSWIRCHVVRSLCARTNASAEYKSASSVLNPRKSRARSLAPLVIFCSNLVTSHCRSSCSSSVSAWIVAWRSAPDSEPGIKWKLPGWRGIVSPLDHADRKKAKGKKKDCLDWEE